MKSILTRMRILGIIILLMILIVPNQIQATAIQTSSDLKVTIGNIQGYVGETVDVPVKISKPLKGIASYGIEINYDKSALKIKGIKPNGASETCSTSNDECFWTSFDDSQGFVRAAWVDTTGGDQPITESTTLFTMQFQILDTHQLDSNGLSIQASDKEALSFTDSSNLPLSVQVQNGSFIASHRPSNTNSSTRQVDVTVGEGGNTAAATVDITRKVESGVKIDEVNFDESKAMEVVQKAIAQKVDVSTILLTDSSEDKADEMKVNVLHKALGQLGENHIALQIETPSATISLPQETVQSLDHKGNDLYFRVAPIRKEGEQQKAIQETLSSNTVRKVVCDKTKDIQVYGSPITIETNYSNYKTNVLFPLTDISLPADTSARDVFLNTLRIYVKHTDGTEELLKGDIVKNSSGKPISLKIQINKFSTFTVLGVPQTEVPVNHVPVLSHVTVTGSKIVGSILKGAYTYSVSDRDPQGKTIFRWYRADNSKGLHRQVIKGATKSTYTLTSSDKGKYIGFEVVPIASKGNQKGNPVVSAFVGKIVAKNTAPTVSGIKVTGEAMVGKGLHVSYKYHDADGDKQGKTIIRWYQVVNSKKQIIQGATKTSYTISSKDVSKRIIVEVTPVATSGVKTGMKKVSPTSKIIQPKKVQYNGYLALGVIKSKSYVEKIGSIIQKEYHGKVIIKKSGIYYKLTANFKTKEEATRVAKKLKSRKLIIHYSI